MIKDFAEQLVRDMPDAVVYADNAGMIRLWNNGAARLFGFAPEEALGQSLDLIIPASLRGRHWTGYQDTMRTGKSRYADGQLLSVPAIRKDGSRISVAFTIVPFLDQNGSMDGIAAVMRDATAQFEETKALRREVAALRAAAPTDTKPTEPVA